MSMPGEVHGLRNVRPTFYRRGSQGNAPDAAPLPHLHVVARNKVDDGSERRQRSRRIGDPQARVAPIHRSGSPGARTSTQEDSLTDRPPRARVPEPAQRGVVGF